MYVYIYVYIYWYTYMYISIYIYVLLGARPQVGAGLGGGVQDPEHALGHLLQNADPRQEYRRCDLVRLMGVSI